MSGTTLYRAWLIGTVSLACVLLIPGCNRSESESDALTAVAGERDSLARECELTAGRLREMTAYVDTISFCLDSISRQEQLLLLSADPETNRRYTREEVKTRLEMLADIISRQREHISELTDRLSGGQDSTRYKSLANMVIHLRTQLDAKESRIASLLTEISNKNRSIAVLTADVTRLKSEVSDITAQNSALAEAVVTQTEIINEGYILIRTKEELKQMGILSKGGLFKKSSFKPGQVKLSQCQKVDVSQVTQIPLPSGDAKILTPAPAGSFRLARSADKSSVLTIIDSNAFWSLSNVLVISL